MERSEFNIVTQIAKGGQKVVYSAVSKNDPNLKVVIKDAQINSAASLQRIMRGLQLYRIHEVSCS